MAFKGLLFVALLRAVILGSGPPDGTVPTRHVRNAIEIGKVPGSGMVMSIPPNTLVKAKVVYGAGAEIGDDGDEPMDCPTPPWQTTAQQLLAAQSTDMPEEVRLSLQKALAAKQAKQKEITEPTKAEATARFQKATSQLKKAGQAKAQAEQRLAKAKEQVAQLETKLQDATEGLSAAETEVEQTGNMPWDFPRMGRNWLRAMSQLVMRTSSSSSWQIWGQSCGLSSSRGSSTWQETKENR